jgi:hypothetical protein
MQKHFKVGHAYSEEERKARMKEFGWEKYDVSVIAVDGTLRYRDPENGQDLLVLENYSGIVKGGLLSNDTEANIDRKARKASAIYWKAQPGTAENGHWRLDIDSLKNGEYESIDRDHAFSNKLTTAYKYQDRIFAALEKQTLDPVELIPTEEAIEAFRNADWEELTRLFLNLE